MSAPTDTIIETHGIQNIAEKTTLNVVPKPTMSTAALTVGLIVVTLALVGIVFLANYLDQKYKKTQ